MHNSSYFFLIWSLCEPIDDDDANNNNDDSNALVWSYAEVKRKWTRDALSSQSTLWAHALCGLRTEVKVFTFTHKPKFYQTALKLIKRRPQADRNYKWDMTFYSVYDSGSKMNLAVKIWVFLFLISFSPLTWSPLTDLPETAKATDVAWHMMSHLHKVNNEPPLSQPLFWMTSKND